MNLKKENNGITLVALVITIIILLILAGITINSLTGSGLFDKVKLAKEKSENAEKLENETLCEYENEIGRYIDGTRNNFQGTIWYPDGTDEQPTTISANQRIEIPNPYPNSTVFPLVEIFVDGRWGTTGWAYDGNGYGVKASRVSGGEEGDKIIIQSGSAAICGIASGTGSSFGNTNVIYSAPYRVTVVCLE